MGHLVFIILHILALFMFGIGLIITIPLHIIYASSRSSNKKREQLMEALVKAQSPEEYAKYHNKKVQYGPRW